MGRKLDMRSWKVRRSPAVQQVKRSPITWSQRPGRDKLGLGIKLGLRPSDQLEVLIYRERHSLVLIQEQ
jgi:hypothetical protein